MPSVCGDGVVALAEECDDANVDEGDGCGSTCLIEHPEVCPGTIIHLDAGQAITITNTTVGASDKFAGSMGGVPGNCIDGNWTGPDLIYQVIPSADATLDIIAEVMYPESYVHVRSQCPGSKDDTLACQFRMQTGNVLLSFSVLKNVPYFLAVDSFNDRSGSFKLILTLK